MAGFRQIKSPVALAAFGAFFVPEPVGTCPVLLAAIWWLWRKLYYSDDADLFLEISDRNLSFYIFRAGQRAPTTVVLHIGNLAWPAQPAAFHTVCPYKIKQERSSLRAREFVCCGFDQDESTTQNRRGHRR
jgi:hypothetical protein